MFQVKPKSVEDARALLGLETFEFDRVVIGKLLKSARDSLSLKLKDIEIGTGVAASHVWSIERGNKDVSVERLMRLACFYGFSPGLLIEAGIMVKWAPIHNAAQENVATVLKDFGWKKATPARKAILAEFVAALAVIMTYLLRSTRPSYLIEWFDFPSLELKHRFRLVAQKFEFLIPPQQKMVWLQHMSLLPELPLKECGLLRQKHAQEYEQLIAADLPGVTRPWVPKPRGSISDFKKAIDLPPHSEEERAFLNSLSSIQKGPPAPVAAG